MGEQTPLMVNITDIHEFRRQIDASIQIVNFMIATHPEKGARELSLVRTKLQEAKMWAGKVLEEIGSELPAEYRDKA